MNEENIKFHHEDPIQIRFNDVDGFGHINNTSVQEYFDLGRVGYFNKVFENKLDWDKFGAIVASIKTDFLVPVFLKDDLLVKTKIIAIGNKSIKLIQHIVDNAGNLKATCGSVMVGFDGETQESVVIPEGWRTKIKALETDMK